MDAQSASVLARELAAPDILGALNAVSLAGRPSDDIADALQALLGIVAVSEAMGELLESAEATLSSVLHSITTHYANPADAEVCDSIPMLHSENA